VRLTATKLRGGLGSSWEQGKTPLPSIAQRFAAPIDVCRAIRLGFCWHLAAHHETVVSGDIRSRYHRDFGLMGRG